MSSPDSSTGDLPAADAPLHLAALIALSADSADGLATSPFGPFVLHACASIAEVRELLAAGECDALIVAADAATEVQMLAREIAPDVALLVIAPRMDARQALQWQHHGAQDVILRAELGSPTLALRLRGAVARKRDEREARKAYATDLETGLPHQQQFIEHVSQLLALREREPAPMAVLALRIEGYATTETRLGREAANTLRRKVGVRVRAGVRASDVVASLGDEGFAVLLGSILSPDDAGRVGAKLIKALMEPFKVSGENVTVAVALGVAQYPHDAAQPDGLLRRAVGLAAGSPAHGRAGFANYAEGGASQGAANDE